MVQMNDESEKTLWCGNLHEKVTEELLFELFLQAGPVEKVKIVQGSGPRYAFITFQHSMSVPYTIKLMNGIRLYDRPLRLQHRTGSGNASTPSATQSPVPSPVTLNPVPQLPQQANPMPLLAAQQQLPTFGWYGSPAVCVSPLGVFNVQHAPFHRSSSEPDSVGAFRNGRKGVPLNAGPTTEQSRPWNRTPYSRPSGHHREFTEPSPFLSHDMGSRQPGHHRVVQRNTSYESRQCNRQFDHYSGNGSTLHR